MTPREEDVAFVLEGVRGVRGVYAVKSAQYDFAVLYEDQRSLAEAHYAVIRVLDHSEGARVLYSTTELPSTIARTARALMLDPRQRDAARLRVPPAAPRPPLIVAPLPSPNGTPRNVLVVDWDPAVLRAVQIAVGVHPAAALSAAYSGAAPASPDLDAAVRESRFYDEYLCAAEHAFGPTGFLARVTYDRARRTVILASKEELEDARARVGDDRVLVKPLDPEQVRARIIGRAAEDQEPALTTAAGRVARRVKRPPPSEPVEVLLVGVPKRDVAKALEAIFGKVRYCAEANPERAANFALENPTNIILCSPDAAYVSDILAGEDPEAAKAVVTVRDDVSFDEVLFRNAIFEKHPELAARGADPLVPEPVVRPAYRRVAVLVIDEDVSSQILFSAGVSAADADISHCATSLAAFEHVVTRAVDIVVVSATLRSDGGEPFYRTLWNLRPELKPRTVLIAAADSVPMSARATKLPRILERPLSRATLERIVDAFRA